MACPVRSRPLTLSFMAAKPDHVRLPALFLAPARLSRPSTPVQQDARVKKLFFHCPVPIQGSFCMRFELPFSWTTSLVASEAAAKVHSNCCRCVEHEPRAHRLPISFPPFFSPTAALFLPPFLLEQTLFRGKGERFPSPLHPPPSFQPTPPSFQPTLPSLLRSLPPPPALPPFAGPTLLRPPSLRPFSGFSLLRPCTCKLLLLTPLVTAGWQLRFGSLMVDTVRQLGEHGSVLHHLLPVHHRLFRLLFRI